MRARATLDYGLRTRGGLRGPAKTAMTAGVCALVAVVALTLWAGHQRRRVVETEAAAVYGAYGPPCPTATPERLPSVAPPLKYSFDYGGMTLLRSFGEADCAWIRTGDGRYPICRFNSAGALEAKDGKADLLFVPGVGRPAAVMRRRGVIICVMAQRAFG